MVSVERRAEHNGREVIWQVTARRSTYNKLGTGPDARSKKAKAQVFVEAERPFRLIKQLFDCVTARFRNLSNRRVTGGAVRVVKSVDEE